MPDQTLAAAVRDFLTETYEDFGQVPPSMDDAQLNQAVALVEHEVNDVAEEESPHHKAVQQRVELDTMTPSVWLRGVSRTGKTKWTHAVTREVRYQEQQPGIYERGMPDDEEPATDSSSQPPVREPTKTTAKQQDTIPDVGGGTVSVPATDTKSVVGDPAPKPNGVSAHSNAEAEADYKANGTKAKAFKSWFGDWENDPAKASKVVNQKGEPQETEKIPGTGSKVVREGKAVVVYHATAKGGFNEFKKEKVAPDNLFGRGFYFTEDKGVAEEYRKKAPGTNVAPRYEKDPEESQVFSCYLNIRNPLDADKDIPPKEIKRIFGPMLTKLPASDYQRVVGTWLHKPTNVALSYLYHLMSDVGISKDVMNDAIQKAGYDGLTHIGGQYMGSRSHRVWIAFEPNQVKAVDNLGTFDATNSNITLATLLGGHKSNSAAKFNHRGFTIRMVDAEALRAKSLDTQEFGNFGVNAQFKFVPPWEIWLSDKVPSNEQQFLLDNAVSQMQAVRQGKSASEAYDFGLAVERSERERAKGVGGDRPQHNEVPQDIYKEHWLDLHEDGETVQVWIVDGMKVRNMNKTDFVCSGHSYVYPWIPENEIYIEDQMDPSEWSILLTHENTERQLMKHEKKGYDDAHKAASKAEFEARQKRVAATRTEMSTRFHKPENYDKIKNLEGGKELWAGANDWENGWSWAWIVRHGGKEPEAFLEVDHAKCPGCLGKNDQHIKRENSKVCQRWAEEHVTKWAREKSRSALSTLPSSEVPQGDDLADPAGENILRQAVQAMGQFSDRVKRELLEVFNDYAPTPILLNKARRVLDKYRPALARLLTDVQLASALSAMKKVMDKLPPPEALPETAAGEPVLSAEQQMALEPIVQQARGVPQEFMEGLLRYLPPDWRAYVKSTANRPSTVPPRPPPLIPAGGEGEGEPPLVRFPIIDEAVRDLESRQLLTKPEFDALADGLKWQAFTVAGIESEAVLEKVRDLLAEQVREGPDFREFQKQIDEEVGVGTFMGERHQEVVFRNAIQASYSKGFDTIAALPLVQELLPYEENLLINDDRSTELCKAVSRSGLDGTAIFRVTDPWYRRFVAPRHHGCFVPGTIVQGKFNAGLKLFYSGTVVEITSERGNSLTVTANHPILTPFGFIAAHDLSKGDNLLSYVGQGVERPNLLSMRMPESLIGRFSIPEKNKYYRPATIQKVFRAFGNSCNGAAWRAPATADDLYGDAKFGDGNIEIVAIDRELLLNLKAEFSQGVSDLVLATVDDAQSLMPGLGHLNQRFRRSFPALTRFPGSRTLPFDLRSGIGRPLHFLCFGAAAHLNASRYKTLHERGAVNARFAAQLLQGFSSHVSRGKLLEFGDLDNSSALERIRVSCSDFFEGAEPYASAGKDAVESEATDSDFASELVERFSGLVATDPVIKIRKYNFSGHVYDLQSKGGWILSNNIFTSNCRCGRNLMTIDSAARKGVQSARRWLETGIAPEPPDYIVPPAGVELPKGWAPHPVLLALMRPTAI